MEMSKQPLRDFESRLGNQSAALESVAPRRACLFTATAAMTGAGCYEMYEVLQVGGVTMLEWAVLLLFVPLFAWIAFSFMSALAGFAVLLLRSRDPLGIDPDAPLPSIGAGMQCCCRPTTKTLTGSWLDFVRCTSWSASPDTVQGSTGLC